ncbi:hypothetical protein [Ruegeria sp. HKCCA5763]|uniref:hypothetical protein n=1 Tax=Ruegeria sp. HKCCA5763 TaxID=2682987 RepID=UPI00148A0F2E|nr:hypothetical protein [Ruegeria sp. HKCCA5763]
MRDPPPGLDVSDNGLPAIFDVDVLHGDCLLSAISVFAQGFNLRRVGSGQFVVRPFVRLELRELLGIRHASTDRTNVERSFGTLESQVIKLIHGYTGRRPGELPSYDANANGVLVTEELYGILTRYFIDEYPSRRHMGIGMGGRRPAEVLKELNETRGLFSPINEDKRRIHLGLKQSLTPTDEGVRAFSGIWYNSDEFQRAVDRQGCLFCPITCVRTSN